MLHLSQVHVVVPTEPLLVAEVSVTADGCHWGKVHPDMFPKGYLEFDPLLHGWCLLVDARDGNDVYWVREG